MVACNSDELTKARNYILQFASGKGVSLSTEQVNSVVDSCCKDVTSKQCVEALAAIIATQACDAYTNGACKPCCEYAGNFVAPIITNAAFAVGSILKTGWDAFAGLFGSKKCDYDPGYNDIRASYVKAFKDIVSGYADSWNKAHTDLGIRRPSWARDLPKDHVPVKDSGFNWLRPCRWDDKNIGTPKNSPFKGARTVSWADLIVYNAYQSGEMRGIRKNTIVDHGSNGSMVLYGVKLNPITTPEHFFDITWKHWSCSDHWSDVWQDSVKALLEKRWKEVEGTTKRLTPWLSETIAQTVQAMHLQTSTRFKGRLAAARSKARKGSVINLSPGTLTKDYVEGKIDALNTAIFDALDEGKVTEACLNYQEYDSWRDGWDAMLDAEAEHDIPIPADVLAEYDLGVDHWRTVLDNCMKGPTTVVPIEPKTPEWGKDGLGMPPHSVMMSASQARSILLSVWKKTTGEVATIPELQIAQAIARFEGRWGSSRAKNNWGGVQCTTLPPCPSGCFEYTDQKPDGTRYQGCLKEYPTQADGAADMVRQLTIRRPSVWSAMKTGDAGKVASTMRATHYHGTAPSAYQKAIYDNAVQTAKELGEPLKVKKGSTKAAREASGPLLALGLALVTLVARKRKG